MKYFFILLFLSVGTKLSAHSPYSIGFQIENHEDQVNLRIHLTPKTAFDIIQYLRPELQGESNVMLEDYKDDFEEYFNEKLTLQLGDERAKLKLLSSNLKDHDSYLIFSLDENPGDIQTLAFAINAFDFYNKPKFFVTVDAFGFNLEKRLTKQENQIVLTNTESNEYSNVHSNKNVTILYSFIGLIVLFVLAIMLKRLQII